MARTNDEGSYFIGLIYPGTLTNKIAFNWLKKFQNQFSRTKDYPFYLKNLQTLPLHNITTDFKPDNKEAIDRFQFLITLTVIRKK